LSGPMRAIAAWPKGRNQKPALSVMKSRRFHLIAPNVVIVWSYRLKLGPSKNSGLNILSGRDVGEEGRSKMFFPIAIPCARDNRDVRSPLMNDFVLGESPVPCAPCCGSVQAPVAIDVHLHLQDQASQIPG